MQPNINKNFLKIFVFFLGLFVFKALYLYFLPLPLSYDEAYYWDWSRFLDFGYYNKPPMIAWIIRFSTEIFGNTEFAVRLPALICITLTIFFSYFLIAKHFDKNKASLIIIFFSFVPILTIYSFIMTIDPPLLLFWILSLLFFMSYLESPSYRNAVFAGIFIGLGLLTKQTMSAFLFLSMAYLMLFKRNVFFRKETFFLYLTAILIYFPNIYWNYKHQFVLFKHTEEHFSRKALSVFSFLKFVADSIGVYTPLFLVFLFTSFLYIKNFFRKPFSENLKFLYFLSFPTILGFIFLSFFIKLNVNWILPFVITGFLFLFGWFSFFKKYENSIYINTLIAIVFSFVIYIFGYFPQIFPEPAQVLLEKFRGWKLLAKEVEEYYNPKQPIVTENRAIAATLAFYLKGHPEVYVVQFKEFPENQYHLWRKADTLTGKRVLVVKKWLNEPLYLKDFKKLEELKVKVTRKRYRYFSIWEGIFNFKR